MDKYEVARVLDDAADLLLIHGRCTGEPVDSDGRLCVRGAILSALLDDVSRVFHMPGSARQVSGALSAYLARHPEVVRNPFDEWIGSYPDWIWNDETGDDFLVIDTLRRCAKELRG